MGNGSGATEACKASKRRSRMAWRSPRPIPAPCRRWAVSPFRRPTSTPFRPTSGRSDIQEDADRTIMGDVSYYVAEATLNTRCRTRPKGGTHAPHSERQPDGHPDHLHRSRAGKAAGIAVVDERASAFHGASAGLCLDQPASKPRRAAHRQLREMAKSRTPAAVSKIP